MSQQPKTWGTDNLNLAAWLWHRGFLPRAVPTGNRAKVNFQFQPSTELDEAVVIYVQGNAQVNPASFDLIKDQLHRLIREAQVRRP